MSRRPLSAYNIFFKVQRYLLINERLNIKSVVEIDNVLQEVERLKRKKSSKSKHQKKRLHRRTHGKIGFSALVKTIGLGWRSSDVELKAYFDKLARDEKEKYYQNAQRHQLRVKVETQRVFLQLSSNNGNSYNNNGTDHDMVTKKDPQEQEEKVQSHSSNLHTSSENIHDLNLSDSPIFITLHPCNKSVTSENSNVPFLEPLPYVAEEDLASHALDQETCAFVLSALDSNVSPPY